MNTLLTGFGPFLEIVSNPTERLVRHIEQNLVPGHRLTTCVLPVSYGRAPQILTAAIDRGGEAGRPFDLVLMLGVASNSSHWRVERYGRNENARAPDADNVTPLPLIDLAGPKLLEATIPVEAIVAELSRAGFPAEPSDSAGAYLCNHALYVVLRHLRKSGRSIPAGFLHVPADTDTFPPGASGGAQFTFAQQIAALHITLAALAGPSLNDRRPS